MVIETLTSLVQAAADAAGLDAVVPPVAPSKPGHGDYQSNVAMRLAKAARMPPRAVAEKLVAELPAHDAIERVEVAGPGFLNIHLSSAWLGELVSTQCRGDFGVKQGEGTIVIDYSSPNVAKRMHVGHLRSTVIGCALDRMYRFAGYEVIADNHIGDWGTQFGKLIVAWDAWVDEDNFGTDPIGELERIYVKFSQDATDEMQDQARAETAKLQAGDERNLALWTRFIDASMKEFNTLYERMGIAFDVTYGESHYDKMLQPMVEEFLAAGTAEHSKGAVVIRFTAEDDKALKDQPMLIRKADGAALYGTTDLATVRLRQQTWAPKKMVYVTDTRQQHHFRQLFVASNKLGLATPEQLVHVWFGLLSLPEGAMSSRKGNVIRLKDLLDEAVSRARTVVDEKSASLPEEERAAIAEVVGVGAVRYADLAQNPQTNVVFEWDKMLSMDGNTAPFMLYSLARCRSIQRKGDLPRTLTAFNPEAPLERALALRLLRFPQALEQALHLHRPNMLCEYLFKTAKELNRFYMEHRVLDAEGNDRNTRVNLIEATARTLETGLRLLGIQPLERM
jgi:arginyl-tRNA synthetase